MLAMSGNNDGLRKVAEALQSDQKVVASLDIDNPVKEPGPYMDPRPGSLDGISRLLEVADAVTFNSGKPVDYQKKLREDYAEQNPEIGKIDLIGGMGTVAEVDGQHYHFGRDYDESLADFLEVKQNILSVLAENGWKANMQNNRSYDVGVTRVEAENGEPHSRGHSRANPLFSDKSTRELYSGHLEDTDGFDMLPDYEREHAEGSGGILMQPAPENVNYLADVARVEEPFIGLRFEEAEDGIVFYRDPEDKPVEESEVRGQLEEAIQSTGKEWNIAHHGDGGTEYWKPGIGKQQGLERYLDLKFGDDAVAFHIGDSPSDRIETDRITTIPQHGTELYEEMNPDHGLKPQHVADFSDMMDRARNYGT